MCSKILNTLQQEQAVLILTGPALFLIVENLTLTAL